jgi:protein TonB
MFLRISCVAILVALSVNPTFAQQPQSREAYRQYVYSLLLNQVRMPPDMKRHRMGAITIITFRLTPSGRVVSKRIVKSSGYVVLDREALAAVSRVPSYPRISSDMKNQPVDVTVPIRFNVR